MQLFLFVVLVGKNWLHLFTKLILLKIIKKTYFFKFLWEQIAIDLVTNFPILTGPIMIFTFIQVILCFDLAFFWCLVESKKLIPFS